MLLGAPSIIAVHGVLRPLNGWKLIRRRQLAALVRRTSHGTVSFAMRVPSMEQQRYSAGATLFRAGGPGELAGEMGLFSADIRRTATVVTETDVRCGRIAADRFWALFLQDPKLGGFVVRTIVQRLAG